MSQFVTSNDRNFTCTARSCADNALQIQDTVGLIDLNASFLDVDAIRANLSGILGSVSEAVRDIFEWVERLESEFSLRYAANEITNDVSLFNRINVAIIKLKRSRGMLDTWLHNMHELVLETNDLVNNYGIAVATLRAGSSALSVDFIQSAAELAKRNISKSRSVQKQMRQLLKLDNSIKTNIIKIRSQVESFSSGFVKVDNKLLNLKEFERVVTSLSGTDSPLKVIQIRLAQEINSQRQTFTLESKQPDEVNVPLSDCLNGMCSSPSREDLDKLIARLRSVRDSVLYTDNTKPQIDQISEIALKLVGDDSEQRDQVNTLLDEIKRRTPARTIEYYRMRVRETNGQFLRLNNLKRIIDNLNPGDVSYAPILQDIYDEMSKEVARSISGDDGGNLMEFENDESGSDVEF